MKNNRDYIDDLFKKELNNQQFDVPDDFMEDIMIRIDQEKKSKKRRLMLIFFLSSILVTASVICFVSSSKNHRASLITNHSNKKINLNEKKRDHHTKSIEIRNTLQKERSKSYNLHSSHRQVLKNNRIIRPQQIETLEKLVGSKEIIQKNIIPLDKLTIESEINSNGKEITEHLAEHSKNNIEESKNLVDEKKIDTLKVGNVIKNDSVLISVPSNQEQNNSKSNVNEKDDLVDKKCREIQIYGGYQINLMDRNSKNDAKVNNIHSDFASNFSFGMNTQIARKNFVFGTGLEFTQWKENYSWRQQDLTLADSIQLNIVIPIPSAIDTTGTSFYSIKINEVIYYYQTQSNKYTLKNSLNIINIPLYLGYRINFKKVEFTPKIGVNLGLIRGISYIQRPYYDATFISSNTNPSFPFIPIQTSRIIVTYQMGMDFKKNFKNWYVYTTPFYRGAITSLLQDNKKLFVNFGCNFGVGILF